MSEVLASDLGPSDSAASSGVAAAMHHTNEAAFMASKAEIDAVPTDALETINVDVFAATTSVLGALPEIRALRPELEAEFRRFDFEQFDKLEQYARALTHAHARYQAAQADKSSLTQQAAELVPIRDNLMLSVQSLAAYGLVADDCLSRCKANTGYAALASDLFTLVDAIKSRWAEVANKTPLTITFLNDVADKAAALQLGIGLKNEAPPARSEASLTRARAFTLFKGAQSAVRKAAFYLMSEEEVNELVPPLRRGSGRSSLPSSAQEELPRAEPSVANGSVTNGSAADEGVALGANLPTTSPFEE